MIRHRVRHDGIPQDEAEYRIYFLRCIRRILEDTPSISLIGAMPSAL
jgi:hypothetical protein